MSLGYDDTNNYSTCTSGPKRITVYSKKGKSIFPTYELFDQDTDKEHDPTYMPTGKTTPTSSTRDTMGSHRKVTPDIVIAFRSDVKQRLIDSQLGLLRGASQSGFESASDSWSTQSLGSK